MSIPPDAHEWFSFEDPTRRRTWMFDVTFLESNWTCIFGRGCQGVLTGPTPELAQGCCSYGAHLGSEKERKRVERAAKRLTDDQWQFRARGKSGATKVKRNGEIVTKQVDDACIFLNRPGFHRGPGCALHVLSIDTGESYVGLKPDVCWQLPLHREDLTTDEGHVVTRIAQWERRDWGKGGEEFHWWCTEAPEAFTGRQRVVDAMREELVAMVGAEIVERLIGHLDERAARPAATRLAHPVVRRR